MSVDARLYIDEVLICPYDRNHRIARSRIQRHLVKCEKNFPPNYKQQCPYDATHRLFANEMQEHIDKCPMKQHWLPQEYKNPPAPRQDMIELRNTSEAIRGENWEDESTDHGFIIDTSDSDSEFVRARFIPSIRGNHMAPKRYDVKVRTPRSYSDTMLDLNVSSGMEDLESVTSCQAVGRGSALPSTRGAAYSMYQRYMLARGRAIRH